MYAGATHLVNHLLHYFDYTPLDEVEYITPGLSGHLVFCSVSFGTN